MSETARFSSVTLLVKYPLYNFIGGVLNVFYYAIKFTFPFHNDEFWRKGSFALILKRSEMVDFYIWIFFGK